MSAKKAGAGDRLGKQLKVPAIDALPTSQTGQERSWPTASQCRSHMVGGRLLFNQILNFKKMYYSIFLAIFLALACPKHKSPTCHKAGTTVTTQGENGGDDEGGGGGGEEGHVPPGQTPPPPTGNGG